MSASAMLSAPMPDSLAVWRERYQALAVTGVRSPAVAGKVALHLDRFLVFFADRYGHDRLSVCLPRDVLAWQAALQAQGLAPATVNAHLASLSAFTTWVHAQAPRLFALGDPCHGYLRRPLYWQAMLALGHATDAGSSHDRATCWCSPSARSAQQGQQGCRGGQAQAGAPSPVRHQRPTSHKS